MAITLKVTPEELRQTAGDFQTKNGNVKNYTNQMMQLITGISEDAWGGEAAQAYINKFRGLEDDIAKLCSDLDKETNNLLEIAEQYASAESANVSTASGLSDTVIS